jgi:hypothetical protein
MPATFPSHAAAVLPLKLWRPRRFDGVALVTGSAAPDLYYALTGFIVVPPTHNLVGILWFGLPVALVTAWLVRAAAPTVAVHLPSRPAWLAMPDYGVLGQVRHRWYVTIWSALLGALSHVAWDGFTHAPAAVHGWGVRLVPALTAEPAPGWPWWLVGQHVSTVLGAVAALAVAIYIGRRRLLRAWHGRAPAVPRTPWVFWPVAGAVAAAYPLTWPFLPYQDSPHVQGVRIVWCCALALLAGAAATGLSRGVPASRAGRRTVPAAPGR